MERKLILLGSFLALISVILGALAAHALKEVLTVDQLSSFNTAVRYQMYHGLALIALAATKYLNDKVKNRLIYLVSFGILLFSGSIYFLLLGSIVSVDLRFLGPVTPVGGVLLITTWIYIIICVVRYKTKNN
jgi:uncharacterized membrane protein YgdD (TMEM256/DUF423 family)